MPHRVVAICRDRLAVVGRFFVCTTSLGVRVILACRVKVLVLVGFAELLLVASPTVLVSQQLDWNQKAVVPRLEKNITNTEPDGWNTVGGLVADAKGTLYVLDNQEQRVMVFSADGKLIRSFGRKGQGPGEFQNASGMRIFKDTLWVSDDRNNRLTGFDIATGKFRTLARSSPSAGGMQLALLAFSPSGEWVMTQQQARGADGRSGMALTNERSPSSFSHRVGTRVGTTFFIVEPPRPLVRLLKGGFGRSYSTQPFSSSPLWSVSHDGHSLLHADRRAASSPGRGELLLKSFAPTGAVRWTRSLTYVPRRLTDAEVNKVVAELSTPPTGARPRSNAAAAVKIEIDGVALRDSIERPAYWSPVKGMLSGLDGSIWLLEEGGIAPKQNYYWRLSDSGVPEVRVAVPASHRIIMASRDRVWITYTDSEGMTVLGRYRL